MASVSNQARGCDDSDWGPTKGFGNPTPKSPSVLCPAKSTVKSVGLRDPGASISSSSRVQSGTEWMLQDLRGSTVPLQPLPSPPQSQVLSLRTDLYLDCSSKVPQIFIYTFNTGKVMFVPPLN